LEPKLQQTCHEDGGSSYVRDSKPHDLACNIYGVEATLCENSIALKNHIHNLTTELESANLISNFYKKVQIPLMTRKWLNQNR
jgi:hypothetical protein